LLGGGVGTVRLLRGFLVVHTSADIDEAGIRTLLRDWYRDKAHLKFAERLELNLSRFPSPELYRPKAVVVRLLEKRWGSMSPAGRLMLNQRLIAAPTECIDYVITHELCHRAESNHGSAFFDLLARVMPDWPKRKERLERMMA
jgi:predicted metal-dependent hydrolase